MAWVACDKSNYEVIFSDKPIRYGFKGLWKSNHKRFVLPRGSIKKLIGKKLTWEDDPVEIKEE